MTRLINAPFTTFPRYIVQKNGVERNYPEIYRTLSGSDDLAVARKEADRLRVTAFDYQEVRIADVEKGVIVPA